MKGKNIFLFYQRQYGSLCPILMCALDGDFLVVKQREVLYNALTQTFLIQIYNNAFVYPVISLCSEKKRNSFTINASHYWAALIAHLVFLPSLIEVIQITQWQNNRSCNVH
jgi:hypothetical protein